MSVPVPLAELAGELEHRSNAAYLLTVGDAGRAHCVAVALEWQGGELTMRVGRTSAHNAGARGEVTLLSPPVPSLAVTVEPGAGATEGAAAGGPHDAYSLIVDAEVTATLSSADGGDGTVRVRPVHAVLHRPARREPAGSGGDGCVHDCLHVYDATSARG